MRRLRAASSGLALLQHAIRDRLGRRGDVVHVRVVLRFARAVVRVADDVVRPEIVAREAHAVSAVEADAQHPVESPLRFLDQPRDERRVAAASRAALGEREHRVGRLAGVDHALRQIARVVPPAAIDDALVAVRREPVEVIDAVRAGHGEAAPLAVEEVERFPDRVLPHVGADAERTRRRALPARIA